MLFGSRIQADLQLLVLLASAIDLDMCAILDGPLELTIDPGTQPNAVSTVRGQGMPKLRAEARGDLHAHLEVVVPTRLDGKQSDLLRGYKKLRDRDHAEVVSTQALTAAQLTHIRNAIREAVGKTPELTARVDPSILGGLKVKVGSKLFDASLKTKLDQMKFALRRA